MPTREAGRKRVLVVDDDRWVRDRVTNGLEEAGFEVLQASNGFTGLYFAGALHPDAIVLDVALPEISRCEVMHALKQDRATRDIPVIALSSRAAAESICGPRLVLSKPVKLRDLAQELERATA